MAKIGLDFGTHQTKVCIKHDNGSIEFFKFENDSYYLPSTIQINSDETLSFGFFDNNTILKQNVIEPTYKTNPILPCVSLRYNRKTQRLTLSEKYVQNINKYERELKIVERENNNLKQVWENRQKPPRYHYFKLSTYCNKAMEQKNFPNGQALKAEILSAWYMAYVLLSVCKYLSKNFLTVIGVPGSMNSNHLELQKKMAKKVFANAMKLYKKYKTKSNFLQQTYTTLLEDWKEDIDTSNMQVDYGLTDTVLEGYAGLSYAIANGRIPEFTNLHIDIGGGTADFCLYWQPNGQPLLDKVHSISKGLNFIFEKYKRNHPESTLPEIQQLFWNNSNAFSDAITIYKNELHREIDRIVTGFISDFKKTHPDVPQQNITNALQNRTITYCGGGAIYKGLRRTFKSQAPSYSFNVIRLLDHSVLDINNLKNRDLRQADYAILINSYGMATFVRRNDMPQQITQNETHATVKNSGMANDGFDYGLGD